jgi:signal transduction histidine kinase
MYNLRSSIAKDLHDDVGSALSSIALLSKIAQEEKINARLKPEEIFSRIGDTSKRMIDLMDDIVWSVNPDNDRFSNMLIRMREYAVEMLEAKNIGFTFKMNEDVDALKIPMQMRKDYFLIFKEAVNNLAKYSECNHASVFIDRVNRNIVTTISDNGKGFDENRIHSGSGLKNMRDRAGTLKGKLEIHTAKDKGTIVTLVIPVP